MMIGRKVKRTSSNSVLTETKNKIFNWFLIKKKIKYDCTCIHTVAFSVLFYFEKKNKQCFSYCYVNDFFIDICINFQ